MLKRRKIVLERQGGFTGHYIVFRGHKKGNIGSLSTIRGCMSVFRAHKKGNIGSLGIIRSCISVFRGHKMRNIGS